MPNHNPAAERLAREAIASLRRVNDSAPDDPNHRAAVQAAVVVEELIRTLRRDRSGRDMILATLTGAYPDAVSAAELRHASGIQEFARRIRELRDEGYRIDSLGSSYRLVELEPVRTT